MNKKIQDLLERLEFNAVLYMQTGENRFLDVVRESKHEIVEENKRLREALENAQEELFSVRVLDKKHDGEITGLCIKIRKVLNGDEWE